MENRLKLHFISGLYLVVCRARSVGKAEPQQEVRMGGNVPCHLYSHQRKAERGNPEAWTVSKNGARIILKLCMFRSSRHGPLKMLRHFLEHEKLTHSRTIDS